MRPVYAAMVRVVHLLVTAIIIQRAGETGLITAAGTSVIFQRLVFLGVGRVVTATATLAGDHG